MTESPATCEEDGERIFTAVFANPAFSAQTMKEVIPASGHDWGEPV